MMKRVSKGRVVCCPLCGTTATVSEVAMDQFSCRNCGARFGGWVVNGFVVTFESDKEEDYLQKFDACKEKLQMLYALSN